MTKQEVIKFLLKEKNLATEIDTNNNGQLDFIYNKNRGYNIYIHYDKYKNINFVMQIKTNGIPKVLYIKKGKEEDYD